MQITFLLTQSLESPSGLGRYWPLAKELAKRGHTVHIVALHHHWASLKKKAWICNGVHIHYVAQMHVKKVGSNKAYFKPYQLIWILLVATLKLTWGVFKTKANIIHVGKPHPMNSIAAWIYKIAKGVPLYLDCDDYEAASNRFSSERQRRLMKWFEDHLPLWADLVTVNTYFTRQRLINLGCRPERVIYLPNGVDRERFANFSLAKVKQLRDKFNLQQKKVILYVGSLSLTSHNVDLLVKAFARVAACFDDVRLMLVGGGEDRELLVALAHQLNLGDKVIHVGKVDSAEIPNYYKLAYLSVDPVVDSGAARGRSPLKIFESFAMGVPIVTGDVGDRRAILHDAAYGFLTQPGNVDSLADTLIDALSDQKRIDDMRKKILTEREQSKIYWDLLVDEFAKVYVDK